MSILNNILKTFVGDKTKKDLNQITPLVNQIKTFEKELEALSHDQLREKTETFKKQIADARASFDQRISELQKEAETTPDLEAKEQLYQQIDQQKDEAYQASEETLNQILPVSFTTAKRFKENETITVTATPYDREIAQTKTYVKLKGDQAFWANSWDAAGKPITWDMVHYDVQLIGGIALH